MMAKPAIEDVGQAVESMTIDGSPVEEIESLCMRCYEQGTTRLLITNIPHFRELVLMAFECPHCHEKNNEVQFAGSLQPKGCKISLTVKAGDKDALDRQVVKSDAATIRVVELDLEIPPQSQKGTLSTVEGVLTRARDELAMLQEERRKVDPKTAEAIDEFLAKLNKCATGEEGFTIVVDDPTGNSFVQNPHAPKPDPLMTLEYYERTAQQNSDLGYLSAPGENEEAAGDGASEEPTQEGKKKYVPAGTTRAPLPHGSVGAVSAHNAIAAGGSGQDAEMILRYSGPEEVMAFPASCSACIERCETRMYVTNIPYFKEVIVMATTCDHCGYKNSELKAGGSISEKGKKIALLVRTPRDLTRDVIKSDTAAVVIPELDLELTAGTLGGRVTTVEGLIMDIADNLKRLRSFDLGDSAPQQSRSKWQELDSSLRSLAELKSDWHLILDDALANSFIAPATDSFDDDPQLVTEEYERSDEQNEELGLNDIDTEDYAKDVDNGKEHKEESAKEASVVRE